MLVFGDADMITPGHIVTFYHLLGGGLEDAGWQRGHMSKNRLAILPDLTHHEVFLSPFLGSSGNIRRVKEVNGKLFRVDGTLKKPACGRDFP